MQIYLRNRISFWDTTILFSCLTWLALAAAASADFPAVYNSEADTSAKPPTPQESLAKLTLPPGFKATVFAAEPDVQNPIGMAWDSRGVSGSRKTTPTLSEPCNSIYICAIVF